MNVFNHSIFHINEGKFVLNTINFNHLYNDSNKSHQAIGIGIIGDSSTASIFINSILCEGNLHILDKDTNIASVYPFPSFQKQKDLYVIDCSSININDDYNYSAISSLLSLTCCVIVLSIPYQQDSNQYSSYFRLFLQIIKQCNKMSAIILHYNVPSNQCERKTEMSTSTFLSRLPFHISTQLNAYLQTCKVIDIPTPSLSSSLLSSLPPLSPPTTPLSVSISESSESINSSLLPQPTSDDDELDIDSDTSSFSLDSAGSFQSQPNTPSYSILPHPNHPLTSFPFPSNHQSIPSYQVEINYCIEMIIQSIIILITPRSFISQFYLACSIYQIKQEVNYNSIQKLILTSCHIPTPTMQSFFLSLWNQLCPNPSLSLSHTHFGNDYYLRIQDRIKLCEYLTLLFIASQFPSFYFDAMNIQTSNSYFRDLHKVLHSSIQSILPCSSNLIITKSNNPYQIQNVENRAYFRHEEQDVIQIPCITPAGCHDHHTSVYSLEYQSWFHKKHGVFHWKGECHPASIRHLDQYEYHDIINFFAQYKLKDRLFPLIKIQSLCSSSRQKIIVCKEKDLPVSKKNYSICPYCIYCWKELSISKHKKQTFVVSYDDGVYYSQNEGKWVCEDIYLVQCNKCCEISVDDHFHVRSYPYSVDGVPALFLPSVETFHLCPLCHHLISKQTIDDILPSEGFSISPRNINQKQERKEKMMSLLDHMNRTLFEIYKNSPIV